MQLNVTLTFRRLNHWGEPVFSCAHKGEPALSYVFYWINWTFPDVACTCLCSFWLWSAKNTKENFWKHVKRARGQGFRKGAFTPTLRRPLLVSTKLALPLQLEIFGFIVFISYCFLSLFIFIKTAEKSTSPKRKILTLKERAEILRLADEKGPEVCWWIVEHGCICPEFVF